MLLLNGNRTSVINQCGDFWGYRKRVNIYLYARAIFLVLKQSQHLLTSRIEYNNLVN